MNPKAHVWKTLTLLSILLLAPLVVFAQASEQAVDSEIKKVTVFAQGAQVTREAETDLAAGTTALTFAGITPHLDAESIQVKAEGDFTVLSVVHRNNFFEDTGQTEEAEQLQARIAVKQDSLKGEEVMLQVYQQEEEMIVVNKSIGGSQTGVRVAELISAADFFRQRLMDIKSRQLALNNTIGRLRRDIAVLDRQLNEINATRRNRYTSEITVTVTAEQQTRGRFELSYLTPNAGWYPHYDIRVQDVDHPMALAYNANVRQHSDEDWEDVKLTLSTGDPRQSGTRPDLLPWHLGFVVAPSVRGGAVALDGLSKNKDPKSMPQDRAVERFAAEERVAAPVPVQQTVNTTTVEFEIELPYTIPPDGKPYAVKIDEHSVPASYEYYCAPKLDTDAFLTARVTDWEDYYLLNGEANLFFEGTFVGKSFLDVESVSDTLVVSLGRDKGVVVERTKLKEFSKRQLLGSKRTVSFAFEIEVRNTKNVPVRIVVEDQVPLSTDKRIEIDSEPDDAAAFDAETGRLRWRLDLPPSTTETLGFSYAVKYPKGRTVLFE